eukprot:comp20006_c0_seq1/m.24492 comp20006_c0_seq1/g.24492  ORF comp20006_c0_seq1/g.24492 comp20006_c0_seq1/m.24492 type:complete len:527 (-) comp20006_c0_seq1:146-1726(-)
MANATYASTAWSYIPHDIPHPTEEPFAFAATAVVLILTAVLVQAQFTAFKYDFALRKFPTAPGCLPIFGNALELLKTPPWDLMEQWLVQNKYEIVRCQILNSRVLCIALPKHLNWVLNKRCSNYPKDLDLSYKTFLDILGKGIITSEGEYWRKQRTLLSHAFRVNILEDTMQVAKKAVDRLSRKLEAHRGTGKPIEIAEEFRLLTLEVIGELILSLPADVSNQVFPDLYLPIVTEANLRVWHPWRKFMPTPTQFHYRRTVKELNKFMVDQIEGRWKTRQERIVKGLEPHEGTTDILDQTLAVIDPSTWGPATVQQLKDEFKSFILAGHETSASMLTWALYELTQNPDIMERVVKEGSSVFGAARVPGEATEEGDEFSRVPLPGADKLRELNLTVNVLKEALRKYTLVPVVSRYAAEDDEIDGVHVPAGTKVFINIKAVHNNPDLWPEPTRFNPDRFDEKYDPYAFLPFINGPRNCLGQNLALLEARIVLSLLCQRFKFTPAAPNVGEMHEFVVPTIPKHGMHLLID